MQNITDDTLLNQLKTETSSSFELLYKFYFPSIASYIKQNMGSNQDAEDIFQEAIIVLLQKVRRADFILTSSLKTYVYAIAKNLWLKRLRDNKVISVDIELEYESYQSEVEILNNEFKPEKPEEEQVENWLQKITQRCKHILKAIFFYQEPMDSLMMKMGWKNKHTASNQKHKCIRAVF